MVDIYISVLICFIRRHSRRYECINMQICIDILATTSTDVNKPENLEKRLFQQQHSACLRNVNYCREYSFVFIIHFVDSLFVQ